MCRSAPERTEPVTDKNQKRSPILSFRPQRKRSGGIHYVAEMYQRMMKSATWEDSSAPFHYARNDMSGGGAWLSAQVVIATLRNGT